MTDTTVHNYVCIADEAMGAEGTTAALADVAVSADTTGSAGIVILGITLRTEVATPETAVKEKKDIETPFYLRIR